MATVWLTYAWADNEEGDVDYAAQALREAGVHVEMDRWTLRAGERLWDQIATFVSGDEHCDAWILYATPASLGSEPCKEEYAYALDRALQSRGRAFPVIGLFPERIDKDLLPAGIRTRLHVSLEDPHWTERIRASAEGRAPEIPREDLEPYALTIHTNWTSPFVVEVRPRVGTWSPFVAAVPLDEKEAVNPRFTYGPRGRQPGGAALFNVKEGNTDDNVWWVMGASNEASRSQSYFVYCDQLPSKLVFGVEGSDTQYVEEFGNAE